MKKITLFIGIILGAVGWGIVSLLSDKFEPFDSDKGFYIGQFIFLLGAFYYGHNYGIKVLLLYIVGIYIGLNSFAYIFGSNESRNWFLVGLITTLVLLVFPLLFGILGKLFKVIHLKYKIYKLSS